VISGRREQGRYKEGQIYSHDRRRDATTTVVSSAPNFARGILFVRANRTARIPARRLYSGAFLKDTGRLFGASEFLSFLTPRRRDATPCSVPSLRSRCYPCPLVRTCILSRDDERTSVRERIPFTFVPFIFFPCKLNGRTNVNGKIIIIRSRTEVRSSSLKLSITRPSFTIEAAATV